MGAALRNVFEIAPAFRADPSKTSRHTSEFLSVDMEMADIKSHYDIMEFQEKWLVYVINVIKKELGDQINSLYSGLNIDVPNVPFPKISLNEAIAILALQYNHFIPSDKDIDPEGERLICKYVKEKYDSDFVYIIDYPAEFRPFYHMRDEQTGLTKSFDLLYKWLEISTGAQREHRIDILKNQAETSVKSVPLEQIEWYLSYFQYGVPPHGWFWLGQERFIKQLLEKETIKDIPFLFVAQDRLP
jgi:aspartyl/asparaginyl-tRNA synthetase